MLVASEAKKLVKQVEDKNLQEFEEWAINYNLSEKIQEEAEKGYTCLKINTNDLPMNQIAMEKFFNKYGYYISYNFFDCYIRIFWDDEKI